MSSKTPAMDGWFLSVLDVVLRGQQRGCREGGLIGEVHFFDDALEPVGELGGCGQAVDVVKD